MSWKIHDNPLLIAPKILDARYGPWSSVGAALDFIKPHMRVRGLTVGIVITEGENNIIQEYWFRGGVDDPDLVPKTTGEVAVSVLYTNPMPTPVTIGGIDAGSTFDEETMQIMWDWLLYPYMVPAIINFRIEGQATSIGYHDVIPAQGLFKWAFQWEQNIEEGSLVIIGHGYMASLPGLPTEHSYDFGVPITVQDIGWGNSVTFLIQGQTTQGNPLSASFVVSWNAPFTPPFFIDFNFNNESSPLELDPFENSHEGTTVSFQWEINSMDYVDAGEDFVIRDDDGNVIWSGDPALTGDVNVTDISSISQDGGHYEFTIEGKDIAGVVFSRTFSIVWGVFVAPVMQHLLFNGHNPKIYNHDTPSAADPTVSWDFNTPDDVDDTTPGVISIQSHNFAAPPFDPDAEWIAYNPATGLSKVLEGLPAIVGQHEDQIAFQLVCKDIAGNTVLLAGQIPVVVVRWQIQEFLHPEFTHFQSDPAVMVTGEELINVTFFWRISNVNYFDLSTLEIWDVTNNVAIWQGNDPPYSVGSGGLYSVPLVLDPPIQHDNYFQHVFEIRGKDSVYGNDIDPRQTIISWLSPEKITVFLFIEWSTGHAPDYPHGIYLRANNASPPLDVFPGDLVELTVTGLTVKYAFLLWEVESGPAITLNNPESFNNCNFIAPDDDITIKAIITPPHLVTIHFTDEDGVLISVLNPTPPDPLPSLHMNGVPYDGLSLGDRHIKSAETVNIEVVGVAGTLYHFVEWTVEQGATSIIGDPALESSSFEMPAEPVVIYARLIPPHRITASSNPSGQATVRVDLTPGTHHWRKMGVSVDVDVIDVSPGYSFNNWSVIPDVGGNHGSTEESFDFTMPKNHLQAIANLDAVMEKIYHGVHAVKDHNMDLDLLDYTETNQQGITHPKDVLSSFVVTANNEYIVIAHPEHWYSGVEIMVQLPGGISAGLVYEGTQVKDGVTYRVYFTLGPQWTDDNQVIYLI